jgi:hypothetical protein
MNPLQPRDPIAAGLQAVLNQNVIDGIFYFFDKLDEEKKQRYDDNRRKFLEQALRLFEQGELTKEQMKAVIELLPETRTVQAQPVDPTKADMNELLKKFMNNQ